MIGLFLAALCFSESFVITGSDSLLRRGSAYFLHTSTTVVLYLTTAIQIARQIGLHAGIRKLELNYLALSCGVGGLLNACLNGLGNYLHVRTLNRGSILVVFLAYLFMAWALANHRIFNARHVLAAVGHRIVVVSLLAFSAWGLSFPLQQVLPNTAAWVTSTFICGTAVFWLDQQTRTWMGLGDERVLVSLRSEVISTAQQEAGSERLTIRFEQLLAQHHRAPFASILSQQGEKYAGNRVQFTLGRAGFRTLCSCAWITPESLQRRRSNPGLEDLAVLMREHSLGVIVTVPRGSPKPSLLVAVSTKANEWPYTYPEVQRLQNVAELMDNILTRSHLTDQAAMRTRMEHLAMMSRGLAHDLKNLITPISSFLIHTDGRFPEGGAAAEVHAAARRSIRVMTEYLREALFFSERLAPRFEAVDLDRVLQAVCDTAAPRAQIHGISILAEQQFPGQVMADGILLQRMLVNLVHNSIDASAPGQRVILSASPGGSGWLRLQVVDRGRGIDPEVIGRIFDPYFTTKSFGEEVRGFGLGLAISQKIVHLHGGTISVVGQPNHGTTVTVEIPCAPSAPTTDSAPRPAPGAS